VPGSELAIHLLPRLAPIDARAFVLSPTYGSHMLAWPAATRVATLDAIPDGAIAILANPNNPDGRVFTREVLGALSRRVTWLIIDEAFADIAPQASLIPTLPRNALVLRSFGKFYGLAGVRLGFVVGSQAGVTRLATALGDWAVSGPAIAIGAVALADARWREATRARLRDEAAALRDLVSAHGLGVAGGTDLFVLIETDEASVLHRTLAQRAIWTRAFAEQPTWLRLGLPGAGFARLERALRDLRSAPRA
jgi:cobalamin biosynthetic protein CobC